MQNASQGLGSSFCVTLTTGPSSPTANVSSGSTARLGRESQQFHKRLQAVLEDVICLEQASFSNEVNKIEAMLECSFQRSPNN